MQGQQGSCWQQSRHPSAQVSSVWAQLCAAAPAQPAIKPPASPRSARAPQATVRLHRYRVRTLHREHGKTLLLLSAALRRAEV